MINQNTSLTVYLSGYYHLWVGRICVWVREEVKLKKSQKQTNGSVPEVNGPKSRGHSWVCYSEPIVKPPLSRLSEESYASTKSVSCQTGKWPVTPYSHSRHSPVLPVEDKLSVQDKASRGDIGTYVDRPPPFRDTLRKQILTSEAPSSNTYRPKPRNVSSSPLLIFLFEEKSLEDVRVFLS